MKLLDWTPEWETGVASIDAEERELLELVNTLHAAMESGRSRAVIRGVLEDIASYAQRHFTLEEQLMREYGYPEVERHRHEHQRFVRQIAQFREDSFMPNSRAGTVTGVALLGFLVHWLEDHIPSWDKPLGQFLRDRGVL